MTSMSDRLARATEIVDEAMGAALAFFEARGSIAARAKGVQDFVSEADTSVEQLIRARLAQHFPDEAIVGEEMGGEAGEAYWIIDPIDGTTNFLRGSPLFGISLGFVRAGQPELGVVALPAFGEVYSAAAGEGLYRNGQPFQRIVPFEEIRVLSLGDSAAIYLEEVAALNLGLRRAGFVVESIQSTSVGLAFAARGTFDGHLQKQTTMWDLAGGAVIAREAGLDVRIGIKTGTESPWIAAATPELMAATEALWPEICLPAQELVAAE
ncbi:inositol monophosphatase family protein [Rhizobium sp. YIM 134829]|uniref:inositol monophosphatase family protein n=1 Tax=Rhizobium sp. YIM 134829 TaxID=3390453 RepID=UPI00397CDD26